MADNNDDPTRLPGGSQPSIWRGYLASCWRGEVGLGDAVFGSFIVYAAIHVPLDIVTQYVARDGYLPQGVRPILGLFLLLLWGIGAVFVAAWFTVSVWRAARRSYRLGQRLWPIVATVPAVLVAVVLVWLLALMVGFFFEGLMRVSR